MPNKQCRPLVYALIVGQRKSAWAVDMKGPVTAPLAVLQPSSNASDIGASD